jgi:hypothetical protein
VPAKASQEKVFGLTPELEATIEAAIDELDRSVTEAKLQDDPLRLPLAALASFLRAQRQLYVDATVMLAAQIEAVQQPISAADIARLNAAAARHAARQIPRALDRLVIQRFSWMVLVAVGIAITGGIGLYELSWRNGHAERVSEVQHTVDALANAAISHGGSGAAEQWLALMQNNDIIRSPRSCFTQEGRAACSIVLWTETPPSPPAMATQQSPPDATDHAKATTERAGRLADRPTRQ